MAPPLPVNNEPHPPQSPDDLRAGKVSGKLHAKARAGSSVKCSRARAGTSPSSKWQSTASRIIACKWVKSSPCVEIPPPRGSSHDAEKPPDSSAVTVKRISFMSRNVAEIPRSCKPEGEAGRIPSPPDRTPDNRPVKCRDEQARRNAFDIAWETLEPFQAFRNTPAMGEHVSRSLKKSKRLKRLADFYKRKRKSLPRPRSFVFDRNRACLRVIPIILHGLVLNNRDAIRGVYRGSRSLHDDGIRA